jgi:hypothetical protein
MSYALLRLPLASRIQLDDREAMEFSIGQIGAQKGQVSHGNLAFRCSSYWTLAGFSNGGH